MARSILSLLDALEPDVRAAFIQSVQNIRSDAQVRVMVAALERGDIEAALQAIGLGAEYFAPLDRALSDAYAQGGDWVMQEVTRMAASQGAVVTARFAARNPVAEQYLAEQSSRLITAIVDEQRDIIRSVLTENMTEGVNAQRAALDVVGRMDRATGRRTGGVIGLNEQQAGYVRNAMAELRSGDPADLQNYLTRTRRDRRYDRIVRQAIAGERPVSVADATRITGRYSDRLLALRGETIARTELLGSLHHAQDTGLQQLVDQGKVDADAIARTWDAAEDGDTRTDHAAADGQERRNDAFTVGGWPMRFPGDSSFGAPASQIINCRCRVAVSIDFLSGLAS